MKKIVATILVFAMCTGMCVPVSASENISEDSMKAEYEEWVEGSNLSVEDKDFLLENQYYEDQYKKLTEEGWIFQDVTVENVSFSNTEGGIMPADTSYVTNGKIVTSTHIQPTKSKTYYNNKLYSTVQQIKSYVEIGASYLPIPYCWVAATYFSIPANDYAVYFNNGYQKTEENATLYSKDIYYKEGNNYYIGYNVSLLKDSFSILSYYRDSSSAPHQVTKSSNHSFSSPNYNSSTSTLVNLAKKYYNIGWKSEAINYSSQIRLN